MSFMKNILSALLVVAFTQNAVASLSSALAPIPVQDMGRLKPFDTFARESLQLIYGKKEFKNRPAAETVFTWMILPHHWDDVEFVEINHKEVKEKLKFDSSRKRFTPNEIIKNELLQILFQELQTRKEKEEKLNPFFQSVERLQNQITLFKAIGQGYAPGWIPAPEGSQWLALKDFNSEYSDYFLKITKAFAQSIEDPEKELELHEQVQLFVEKVRSENAGKYPTQQKMNLEVQYNTLHPFQWAWVLYLCAAISFLFYFISPKAILYKLSLYSMLGAFLIHTYGFALRVAITGRPPVSNMYETVIWVPWAAVLFSLIFLKVLKNKFFIFAASIIAFSCLVLADLAPITLDSSIQPLQAVLRSNLWLTIHVLTITISYGALFLSFILADIALAYYLINEKKYTEQLAMLRDAIYRAIQVGVVLLGAGTILGGVWADYSWGRFWGWDPKETWALIAFLGYIAILHGRLSGWIKPFWFVVWSILAFNLVVMAWYGVNFVLGAGLHSYGFGGGGIPFVSSVVAVHMMYILAVWFVRSQRAG